MTDPETNHHIGSIRPRVPAPDKAAIKAAIKDGFDIPGCRMTAGQRLVVS